MAGRALSFEARGALRWLIEQNGNEPDALDGYPRRVIQELDRHNFITTGGRAANVWEATAAGIAYAKRIVEESGDGPEDLKGLMSFALRPRR